MTYKTIKNASKASSHTLTLNNIMGGRFYHKTKGWTSLKISGLDLVTSLEINDLLDVIGGRKNYSILLRRYINNGTSYGILSRLTYDTKHGWSYCAGQDYTAELNTIRKILREGN
jgi:hypothetical protein